MLVWTYGLAAVVVVVDVGAEVAEADSVTVTTVVGCDEGLPSVYEHPETATTAATPTAPSSIFGFIVHA